MTSNIFFVVMVAVFFTMSGAMLADGNRSSGAAFGCMLAFNIAVVIVAIVVVVHFVSKYW